MSNLRELRVSASSVRNNSVSFLQSNMWGEFKSRFGWKPYYFSLEIDDKKCPLLVLSRKFSPGFSFAYVPWGPEIECSDEELCELAKQLKKILPKNTVFIRYDLPYFNLQFITHNAQLKKAGVDVQAPDTVIIDLTKSSEDILASMKSKWRYNISLSKKKGIKIKSYEQETFSLFPFPFSLFYSLLKETAKRDRISIHSYDYYKTLFEICEKDPDFDIRLYNAVHEEDTLAAIVVLFYKEQATYLYGASSNIKRNLMAPYALQWQAMQDAKEKGCRSYDLFGIPQNEDPNHPMAGLYRFKTGFGGEIIHRPGCWDFSYNPLIYRLFVFFEELRRKNSNRKKGYKGIRV